jgi:apolipoprotein N-acyltransferase
MIKQARPLVNYALAVFSAILLILAFPDWNIYWLAPFALAPLLYALAHEPRPGRRFLLGYVTGNMYWFGVCYWIQFVLEVHGGMGRWGGWGTFLLFSLIKSLHMAVFAMLAAVVISRCYAIPAVAALWTGIERTHGDLGFAWLCLGNAGIDLPLPMRLAPWVGVYGLSFIFAMMATGAALVAMKRPRKQLLWLLVVPALLLLPSLPAPDPGDRTAVMIQPNVPEELDWTRELAVRLHQMLLGRSLGAALRSKADLIVWPEAPAPIYYYRDPNLQEALARLARLSKAWLVIGTVAYTPQKEPLNSAVLISPAGTAVDRYDKINLVPFGEYVPPMFNWVNRISQEAGDFVPGNRLVVFPFGDHKLGTFICYESAFPHEVREFVKGGANVLVNISNDGYFGHSGAREQHLEIVRMRAAENRRWLLRATNNGITANIDPAGRVVSRLPEFAEVDGAFRYSLESGMTAYTRWGDWFAWGCWLIAAAALFASQWPHYKPRPIQLT